MRPPSVEHVDIALWLNGVTGRPGLGKGKENARPILRCKKLLTGGNE